MVFQPDIIIVIQIIHADDRVAGCKQLLGHF